MSDFDAYGDEMRRLRLSDEDLDRLLGGIASGDADTEELAAFVRAVAGGFAAGPREATARRHLAAIATEARSPSSAAAFGVAAETQRRTRKARPVFLRGGRVMRIGLAVGVLMLCTTGLAVAGVRLPAPAVSVFEELGVGLPNQSDTDEGGDATGEDDGDRHRGRRPGAGERGAGERGSGSRSVAPSTFRPAGGGNRSGKPPAVGGRAPVVPARPERQSGADRGGGPGGRPEDARPPQGRAPEAGLPPKREGSPPGRGDAPPDAEGPAPGSGGPPSGGGPPDETPSGPPAGTGSPGAAPLGGPSPGGDFENRGGPPEHVAGGPG